MRRSGHFARSFYFHAGLSTDATTHTPLTAVPDVLTPADRGHLSPADHAFYWRIGANDKVPRRRRLRRRVTFASRRSPDERIFQRLLPAPAALQRPLRRKRAVAAAGVCMASVSAAAGDAVRGCCAQGGGAAGMFRSAYAAATRSLPAAAWRAGAAQCAMVPAARFFRYAL